MDFPRTGDFLIADPSILGDTSFHRAVVFISAIHDKSPMGFIINKPFDFSLAEVMPEIEKELPLFYGGPVDMDQLFFIYNSEEPLLQGSKAMEQQLYLGGDIDTAIELVHTGILHENNCRFFLGYSGWAKGQLEEEIDLGSWIIQSAVQTTTFFDFPSEELWRRAMINKGGDYRIWADTPDNPNYN